MLFSSNLHNIYIFSTIQILFEKFILYRVGIKLIPEETCLITLKVSYFSEIEIGKKQILLALSRLQDVK